MPGSTPELNLQTAVDADDNADYLTISLRNSLQTIDALYNSTTGHTHSGAHQGGPITSIPAGSIPDGSITSAKIVDGTIATADLANASVTNAKLASDTARANLLTNGGFEIWQRGNGPFTAGFAFAVDRWQINISGGGTLSVSRDTANVDVASSACAVCTAAFAGAGSSLYQTLTKADASQYFDKQLTVSVRVKTSTANAVRIRLNSAAAGAQFSSYHSGSGTYQTLSVSGTPGGADTAFTVAIFFDASCTAYIDNAMLVVGSVAADYAPLHPADDLARCLRYYEVFGADAGWGAAAQSQTAGAFVLPGMWRTLKAVSPTVTTVGATNFRVLDAAGGTGLSVTALAAVAQSIYGFRCNGTVASGLVSGNATTCYAVAGGQLVSEANP